MEISDNLTPESAFSLEAARYFFGGQRVNRYQLQQLTDGSVVVVLGSAGTVSSLEGKPDIIVAQVAQAFSVEVSFLQNLARTINELFPEVGGNAAD